MTGLASPALGNSGDFGLTIERRPATLLLRLDGEFAFASIGRVEAVIERALNALTRHVVFDLSGVSFLDMAALMTVIRTDERSRRAAYDVMVVPPAGRARRVFTLTRAGAKLKLIERVPAA